MHKMTNLEYSFIIKELSPLLVNKHLRRIRKLDEGVYRFKIGEHEVLCQSGVRIHITRRIEASEQIDKFADKAGKELDNARLLGITQINSDRIVSFDFDKGSLIFEMFGEGNGILVHDGKIICAQRYEEWSDRKIKVGEEYKPPKSSVAGFDGVKELVQSDKYVIVMLMKLPLGKEYCLEALSRAGIDEKTPGNKLTPQQTIKLEKEIGSIVADAKPMLFFDSKDGKKINDFSLAKFSMYGALEVRETQTLSEAADEYYSSYEKPNPQREKVLKRIEKQEERKKELVEEEKTYKEKGDFIYSHYQEVEAALALAKEGKFEELERKKKAKADKKEKSIELEIGE